MINATPSILPPLLLFVCRSVRPHIIDAGWRAFQKPVCYYLSIDMNAQNKNRMNGLLNPLLFKSIDRDYRF